MTLWIAEPKDPLIFRDGRPFEAVPGAKSLSLPFPHPSTLAGALRTREGLDAEGRFQTSKIESLKEMGVKGPFLIEIDDETGDMKRWLFEAPKDALALADGAEKVILKKLGPLHAFEGTSTDLPSELHLVGMAKADLRKPSKNAPRYWYWETLQKWLQGDGDLSIHPLALGHNGPIPERRFHVGIDPSTETAYEGALFSTSGLEFTVPSKGLGNSTKMGLALSAKTANMKEGLGHLGGERRFVNWRKTERDLPTLPHSLKDQIVSDSHCRLLLLTPACFANGWMPKTLLQPKNGVSLSLRAAAVGRPQTVSGWDFVQNAPKPARRMAPAGTVYFLEIGGDKHAVNRWIEDTWMSSVSDDKQDRLDGFGICVLGTWDGSTRRMEV